jgi:tetratricopeptide (TPR) repeat protein
LDPNDGIAYNSRDIAHSGKEDYDMAVSDYNEAIRLDSDYAVAYYNRGVAYRNQGKNAKAQADCDRAKKPGYPPH